jgi:long-chain acyl-CoA synthetase
MAVDTSSVTRAFDILPYQLATYPKPDCLAWKEGGTWHKWSTQEVIDRVNALSYGLLRIGVQARDKVAIVSLSRPEWVLSDFGIQQTGATTVPMYPTITVDDYRHILRDAGVKVAIASTEEIAGKLREAGGPDLKIYTFEKVAGLPLFQELLDDGKANPNPEELERRKAGVTPDDLLTLIYTSGTTGTPKGVMLTHDNLIANYKSCESAIPLESADRALSFLPLAHIFERMVTYLYLMRGVSVYYAESIEAIGGNLKEVQPQVFTTVPRLLEKIYDRIEAKGAELSGIKRTLFDWAMRLGNRFDNQHTPGALYDLQLALARKLVFSKWQEALGGKIKIVVTGGGALQPRLARLFSAAGVRVMEGYGLTETSPVISVNRFDAANNVIGTTGPVVDDIEVKIAADGEILTRSRSVMKGYYNLPEQTAEAIDADGWFHTGDIGEFVDGKFLKITDRKKEMFKTSQGKYVAPQKIENSLKEHPLIEQVMVVGDGRKYAAALVVPSFENLKDWCPKNGVTFTSNEQVVKEPKVLAEVEKAVERYNATAATWEQIKKTALLPRLWTIESGELTPSLKVKRKIVTKNFEEAIEGLF